MPLPRRDIGFGTNIKEHSGWWAPLAVAAAVILLSLFVLVYYFLPNPASFIEEHPSPSSRIDRVSVRVGGLSLAIPANYLVFASARKGGSRPEIDIAVSLPDFRGYSETERLLFNASGANSPVVHIKIREDSYNVPEAVRISRVYLEQVADPRGARGPFALSQYQFRDDSGYRGEDLFVGRDGSTIVVLLCERPGSDVPSPNCLRDYPLRSGAALSYRFKRSHLAQWREIASGVRHLVAAFEIH